MVTPNPGNHADTGDMNGAGMPRLRAIIMGTLSIPHFLPARLADFAAWLTPISIVSVAITHCMDIRTVARLACGESRRSVYAELLALEFPTHSTQRSQANPRGPFLPILPLCKFLLQPPHLPLQFLQHLPLQPR